MIKFFKKEEVKSIKDEENARIEAELLVKENKKRLELYNKIIKKVDNLVENGKLPRFISNGYEIDEIYVECNKNCLVYIYGKHEIGKYLGQKLSEDLYYYIQRKTPDWETYLETLIPPPSAPDKSKSNLSRKGAKLPPILYKNLFNNN